jgi:hypothetical protein
MAEKITKFDRNNLSELRAEIDNALEAVLAKHGLTADLGRITFQDKEFRGKLTVSVDTDTIFSVANTSSAEERKFKRYAAKFGMTGNEFGKSFKVRGTVFTITEINPRAKVGGYPVIAKNARGTAYKFPAEKAIAAI